MFTGLIKDLGKILNLTRNSEGLLLEVESSLVGEVEIDDSVSINGVCQTVIRKSAKSFFVQAVQTTLEKTSFGFLRVSERVNLELALRANGRLGGHFVQGHVNGLAQVTAIEQIGDSRKIWLKIPAEFIRYMLKEGSVALDGISLTIADVEASSGKIAVSIIPHTMENTVIKYWKVGTKVNLENDILAKFVENLLLYTPHRTNDPISENNVKKFLTD
ncbi:MAG: riboflavin synthase subunit alpha [Bdellovibrionales bacterium GWA2_49_15]|nr:MAG: riboflavin synthase subunit alpha [Bdellovibrionales bacterium GWA2_49_15]